MAAYNCTDAGTLIITIMSVPMSVLMSALLAMFIEFITKHALV